MLRTVAKWAETGSGHFLAGLVDTGAELDRQEIHITEQKEFIREREKFLDESTVTDLRELRIVHGHGTGQLRRAIAEFLKEHPLVARYGPAPQNQGWPEADSKSAGCVSCSSVASGLQCWSCSDMCILP